MRASLCASLFVLPFTACGDAPAASVAAETTIRDSAGITIVSNPSPETTRPFRVVSEEPTLLIGVLAGDPAYQFNGIAGIARLSDGGVVVANRGTGELRIYDERGAYVRTWGGQGEGPGEFGRLRSIDVPMGDTIFAFDIGLRRIAVFTPGSGFVRTIAAPASVGAFSDFVGRLPDGSFVVAGGLGSAAEFESGRVRLPYRVVRFREGEPGVDTVGTFRGSTRDVAITMDGETIVSIEIRGVPFGPETHVAAAGDRIIVGDQTAGWSYRIYGPDGLARIVRTEYEAPPTAPLLDEFRRRRLEDVPAQSRPGLESMWAEMEFPETVPPHGELVVDGLGRLWAAAYAPPGRTTDGWTVYDPDGRLLGTVAAPPRFRLYDAGDGWILGTVTDDLGVERVALFGLG